jgi:hypothetical protein
MGMDEFVRVGDRDIRIAGRLTHTASMDGSSKRFVGGPAPVVEGLRAPGKRVNLTTIVQWLYSYQMEL